MYPLFSDSSHKACHIFLFLCLTSFTQNDNLQFRPCCCKEHYLILFNGWVIFHCTYEPHFHYPFLCWWPCRLLLCLCYCKQHCNEHGYTYPFRPCFSPDVFRAQNLRGSQSHLPPLPLHDPGSEKLLKFCVLGTPHISFLLWPRFQLTPVPWYCSNAIMWSDLKGKNLSWEGSCSKSWGM